MREPFDFNNEKEDKMVSLRQVLDIVKEYEQIFVKGKTSPYFEQESPAYYRGGAVCAKNLQVTLKSKLARRIK